MKRKYIIQRVIEKEGENPEYIKLYEKNQIPFDLNDIEFIENELLRIYGPGRYRITSIDRKTGKEIIHYSGEVKHPARGKLWTKKERIAYTRVRRAPRRLKIATFTYFFIILLILAAVFFYSLLTMNVSVLILSVMAIALFFLISLVFLDIAFFETE